MTVCRLPVCRPSASSTYRGVRWHPHNGKWEARIFNGAKQVSALQGCGTNVFVDDQLLPLVKFLVAMNRTMMALRA